MHYTDPQLQRLQIMECTKEQMELMAEVDALEMSKMDCYIAVRGSSNVSELSDVLDTIPYEILTSVSTRVKRVYFRE